MKIQDKTNPVKFARRHGTVQRSKQVRCRRRSGCCLGVMCLLRSRIFFLKMYVYMNKSVWKIQKIPHDLNFRHPCWWPDHKWSDPLRFPRCLVLLSLLGKRSRPDHLWSSHQPGWGKLKSWVISWIYSTWCSPKWGDQVHYFSSS